MFDLLLVWLSLSIDYPIGRLVISFCWFTLVDCLSLSIGYPLVDCLSCLTRSHSDRLSLPIEPLVDYQVKSTGTPGTRKSIFIGVVRSPITWNLLRVSTLSGLAKCWPTRGSPFDTNIFLARQVGHVSKTRSRPIGYLQPIYSQ